jgi:hypothetical protein
MSVTLQNPGRIEFALQFIAAGSPVLYSNFFFHVLEGDLFLKLCFLRYDEVRQTLYKQPNRSIYR